MGKRKANQDVDINGPCPMEIDDILAPRGGVRKKRKTTIPKAVKIAVWERIVGLDIGRTQCSVCKTTFITQMDFHCGHIVAEADGGETCVSNLVPICSKCNLSMGRTNLNTFKEQYFK